MKPASPFRRDFTLMVIGQIISLFGNAILRFSLSLHVLSLTGSAAVFGSILALAMVPTVLLSPLGGVLADRLPRQRIMVALDFFTCGLILCFDLFFARSGSLGAITAFLILLSLIQAVYQPSVQASIPSLAAEEALMAANGVVVQVQALSGLLGPILGGVLYAAFGLYPLLAGSALCFFASAVLELFLRIPFTPLARTSAPLAQLRRDLGDTLRFLSRDNPRLLKLQVVVAGINLFLSSLFTVGLPYLVKVHLSLSDPLYGFAEAAMGMGSILGGLLSSTRLGRLGFEKSYRHILATVLLLLPQRQFWPPECPPGWPMGCSSSVWPWAWPLPRCSPSPPRPFSSGLRPPRCWARWALSSPPSAPAPCRRGRPCTACSLTRRAPPPGRWCCWGRRPPWFWWRPPAASSGAWAGRAARQQPPLADKTHFLRLRLVFPRDLGYTEGDFGVCPS